MRELNTTPEKSQLSTLFVSKTEAEIYRLLDLDLLIQSICPRWLALFAPLLIWSSLGQQKLSWGAFYPKSHLPRYC